MKKYFTLLIATLVSASAAMAAVPTMKPDRSVSSDNPEVFKAAEVSSMPKALAAQANAVLNAKPLTINAANPDDDIDAFSYGSRADEGDGTEVTWNVGYTYPGGTIFRIFNFTRKTVLDETGEVLSYNGYYTTQNGILVPPAVENTWKNITNSTVNTVNTVDNEDGSTSVTDAYQTTTWLDPAETCSWTNYTGTYSKGSNFTSETLDGFDLTAKSLPSWWDCDMPVPYQTYNGTTFKMMKSISEAWRIRPGGKANMSEEEAASVTLTYASTATVTKTDENGDPVVDEDGKTVTETKATTVYQGECVQHPVVFDYANMKLSGDYKWYYMYGLGDTPGIFFTSTATAYTNSIWTSFFSGLPEGSTVSVQGIYQNIPAAATDYIAKTIGIYSYYYGKQVPEIPYKLYAGDELLMDGYLTCDPSELVAITQEQTDTDGNTIKVPLTDVEGDPLYGGIVTMKASLLDIFAEDEDTYITIPAGTPLRFEVYPGDCAGYIPAMVEFYCNDGPNSNSYQQNAGTIVNVKNETADEPFDITGFYDESEPYYAYNSTTKAYNFTTRASFWVEMDIEYPYLIAWAKYQQYTNTTKYSYPYYYISYSGGYLGETYEINVAPEEIKESNYDAEGVPTETYNTFTGAVYALATAASSDEITFTYSSEDLKNALTCVALPGNNITTSSGTVYGPGYVIVMIALNQSVTADGWVKACYKGKEVLFNIPAYELSGIGDVRADEAAAVEYYDLQGRSVAVDNASGVLIQKTTMPDGSVRTAKVIK